MTVKITGPVRGAVEGACGHPIDIDFAVELLQELVDDGGMSEFDVIAKLSAARSSDALASLPIPPLPAAPPRPPPHPTSSPIPAAGL